MTDQAIFFPTQPIKPLGWAVGAALISSFLQSLKNTAPAGGQEIDSTEAFIQATISRIENEALIQILEEYGWNKFVSKFQSAEVDLQGLRQALLKPAMGCSHRVSLMHRCSSQAASFLPSLALTCLQPFVASEEKMRPTTFRLQAVVLLVALDGFEQLCEPFQATNKTHADNVQQGSENFLSSLTETIYQYGGDVMQWNSCGSSFVALFGDKNSPMENDECSAEVILRAIYCALQLQEVKSEKLAVRVAVGFGDFVCGFLGGFHDQWRFFFAFNNQSNLASCLENVPNDSLAIAAPLASKISPSLLEQMGAYKLPAGYCFHLSRAMTKQVTENVIIPVDEPTHLDKSDRFDRLVDMLVASPVSQACHSNSLHYLAEVRELTTMFMKWDSYNTTDYADLAQLQRPFLECQTILHELGGFVRQFLVEDKGCVLIACWGVPTAAFLNNAHRALSAAAKIRAKFHELNLQCSIGITTGNVYCGNVGSEIRREYAAVGDVVNLSARLMSKAHGGIYVDEATYARLPVLIWCLFEELEQFSRFSEVRPVLIYSWMGDEQSIPNTLGSGGEEFQVKTVCRSTLLRALDRVQVVAGTYEDTCRARTAGTAATAATAASSRPVSVATSLRTWAASPLSLQVVALEGHLGSGKRTTVRWLLREAKLRNIRVVRVAHIEHRHSLLEYKVIAMLLQEFMGIADADSHLVRSALVNVLRLVYGEDMDAIENVAMPVMKTLFGSLLSEMSPAEGPASRNNARASSKAVIDVLHPVFEALLKGASTIVIIENLHFCDEGSLNCLTALMDLSVNALFVLALEPLERSRDIPIPSIKHIVGEEQAQSPQLRNQTFRLSSGHLFDIMQVFRNNILLVENSTYIYLNEFNLTDIDAMLHLALEPEVVPLGLAQWVQQLSGSSLTWANSIIQMIKANGLAAMMNVVYGSSASGSKMKSISSLEGLGAVPTSYSSDRLLNKTSFVDSRLRAQLKNLILCRFNQLTNDDQLVLKIASVIGTGFSFQILQGIVSPALRAHLHIYLRKLMAEKWIAVVEQNNTVVESVNALFRSAGESATADNSSMYIFSHPMAWETIYETIPLDDRNAIHKIIAELYESKINDDPSLIDRVASQYSHCSQSKSFEYAVKAACYYLRPDVQDMSKSLALLADCLTMCHFVMDIKVLQTLLKAIRDIVFCCHGSMDGTEVFIDPAVSRELSIRRNRQSEEEIELPMDLETSCLLFFCCGGLGQVANNKVRPGTSNVHPTKSSSRSISINHNSHRSVSRRSARSGHSVQSVGTFQSQVSSYTMTSPIYTSSAADYILHNVMRIERVAARLKEQFEEAGKIGMLPLWQREIVFEEDVVIPEQSFKSATAFIRYARASWIRPAANT
eukprot:gene7106-7858_t